MRQMPRTLLAASVLMICAGCSAPRESSDIQVSDKAPYSTVYANEIELPEFIVMLRDSRGTRYLRCKLALVASEDDHAAIHENTVPLREAFVEYLSCCSVKELDTAEARLRARIEMAEVLREKIPVVGELYIRFKSLIIQ
jgi:flagellar basal body-associated protein FliL